MGCDAIARSVVLNVMRTSMCNIGNNSPSDTVSHPTVVVFLSDI